MGLIPNSEGWGHAVRMSGLKECQTNFAIILAVINSKNKDKTYEFNYRASPQGN
jgi:hypothetical protein